MLDDPHRNRIALCLHAMGRNPAIARYDVLQGGISGAFTYRVRLANDTLVLKIAGAESSPDALDRFRREIMFYRLLAGRVSLRVPAVLGLSADEPSPWLCLRAYQPAPPIESWEQRHYLEIAGQLGWFHAAFWNREAELSHLVWLRRPDGVTDPATLQRAAASWHALQQQLPLHDAVTPVEIAWIEAMLSRVDRLDAALGAFPMTLRHGDCHHGNLLMDGAGHWVWADWQETGLGPGPDDLSFLFQRARFAGAAVPEEAAVAAYHHSLEAALEERVPLDAIRRVMHASELRTMLLLWPPFLPHLSAEQLEVFMRRLHHLADRFEGTPLDR